MTETATTTEKKQAPAWKPGDVAFGIQPVPYGKDSATLGSWRCTQYNGTHAFFYFALFTATGKQVATGNFTADKALCDQWGSDDNVITNAILQQEGLTAA